MWNDAVLTPAYYPRISIEPNHYTLDGVAGFTVCHVIGFVTCQIDMPDCDACDFHWYTATGWPS